MRVLGIDPGFGRLGVAVVESDKKNGALLFSDCIETGSTTPFPERLAFLGNEVHSIIKKWKPDAVALETLILHKNQKTAMRVAEVRGMLIFIAETSDLPVFEYTPLEVKMTIGGYGRAEKSQVLHMTKVLVNLKEKRRKDDEVDAIAIGLTCLYREKSPPS